MKVGMRKGELAGILEDLAAEKKINVEDALKSIKLMSLDTELEAKVRRFSLP